MSVSTLPVAPAPAPSTAADLRAQLVLSHDAVTVDAVLASVAALLRDATASALPEITRRYGWAYGQAWQHGRTRIAEQLTAAVPAVPAVRIPQQRTAA